MSFLDRIQEYIMYKFMFGLFDRENNLSKNDDFMKFNDDSPTRFELMTEANKYGRRRGFGPKVAPLMVSIIRNQNRVINSLKDNPQDPRTEITDKELNELVELANNKGAGIVGFTEIPEKLVFQNKAVLSKYVIVLGYEIDKKKIDTAPHIKCQHEVWGLMIN